MLETMKLCVSCKGCRRECPTGVDMAKMKIEVLAAANKRRGLSLRDRLVAYLPRYAPVCGAPGAAHERAQRCPRSRRADRARHRLLRQAPAPALAPRRLSGPTSGFTPPLTLPTRGRANSNVPSPLVGRDREGGNPVCCGPSRPVRRYLQHLLRAGEPACRRRGADPPRLSRDACCAAGDGERAAVLRAHVPVGRPGRGGARGGAPRAGRRRAVLARGVPIVGLEPSCLLTLRDEFLAMLPGAETRAARRRAPCSSRNSWPREAAAGRITGRSRRHERQGAAARPLPPEGLRRHAVDPDRLALVEG